MSPKTNGHDPTSAPDPIEPLTAENERPALVAPTPSFSTTQLAVGFGILAAFVAIAVGRLRRRRRRGGPLDRG